MESLDKYYDRTPHELEQGYERHLFRAGYVLQSAELNELQGVALARQKQLGDALFKDGDIIRDARVVVDQDTGAVTCEAGAVYLNGQVRGVPPAAFTIALTGTVVIGVFLDESVVTEQDDPQLKEPAVEVQAYGEPGAARLKIVPRWGVQPTDPDATNFYPIYYVDDSVLRAKEAPPAMDSVTQAIARYDVDSTGSNYVVEGMTVRRLADAGTDQVYNIIEGRARVNGFGVNLNNSRRLNYAAVPDLKTITAEPFLSATAGTQTVTLARPPAKTITQVTVTREKTVSMTHASVSGSSDPLPDPAVVQVMDVWQGGTHYAYGDDFVLAGQAIDWSPSGNEPAPGSTYQVTYRHIVVVTPTDVTARSFKVTGAVAGTLIQTTYDTMLPRIDRLCIDETGKFVWVQGIATDYNPVRPQVPANLIPLAQVVQNWDDTSTVFNDGVRTVSMREIEDMGRTMDRIIDLMAQQLLISDVNTRESGVKKGIFTDPFLNDDHRDAGQAQAAAIIDGILTLPITPTLNPLTADIATPQTCPYTIEVVAAQTERTGSMKVNPYMAFDVPMSPVMLEPAVDRWTVTQTVWASDITRRFVAYHKNFHAWVPPGGHPFWTTTSEFSQTLSSASKPIEYLRPIEVKFSVSGFGPGETLATVTFDGITVVPSSL